MPEIPRTPDGCFANLPGYPFAPHYVSDLDGYEGMRVHYLDEGPRDAAKVFLCLHGQPTWSYLYRRMIPVFTAAGHRVVAPDLLGFGRSDKPADDARYTFTFHREMLKNLVERLDLRNVVLTVQDWGGLLGLTLPARPRGGQAARACLPAPRPPAEAAAYDAPFPDASSKGGVRRFPNLVPDNPDAEGAALSRRARDWFRTEWAGKTFMAVGMKDPILGPPVMRAVAKMIRNCPPPYEVAEGKTSPGRRLGRCSRSAWALSPAPPRSPSRGRVEKSLGLISSPAGTKCCPRDVVSGRRSGRDLLVRKLGNVRALGRVFDRDGANVARRIHVEQRVFVEIACLSHWRVAELYVQSVGAGKVTDSHGSNRRSKNALWTVSPSASNTTRKNRSSISDTCVQRRMRPSACTYSRIGEVIARIIHSSRITARSGRTRTAAK